MVFVDFLVFFIALAILIKGSDIFVRAASSLAKEIGVSEFIIGLTVVAVGTSIPELATSVSASLAGNSDLILGIIVGSTITNIGFVLAIAAIISILKIDKIALYRDGIFLLSAVVLFFLIAFDKQITALEGFMLLVLFLGYIYHLIRTKQKDKFGYEQYLNYVWNIVNPETYARFIDRTLNRDYKKLVHDYRNNWFKSQRLLRETLTIMFAIAVIIVSSGYIVPSASKIALSLGIPETVLGFIITAIGTSLPELIVSLTAIYRKLNDILIGNIIGSNIANLMLIGGISSIISPIKVNDLVLFYMIPFTLFQTLLFLQFIRTTWFIKKLEGIIFLGLYLSFMAFIIFLV